MHLLILYSIQARDICYFRQFSGSLLTTCVLLEPNYSNTVFIEDVGVKGEEGVKRVLRFLLPCLSALLIAVVPTPFCLFCSFLFVSQCFPEEGTSKHLFT